MPQTTTRPGNETASVWDASIARLTWTAPEQVVGPSGAKDPRSDVYAVGVMLYQALTGRFPYVVSGAANDVRENILHAPPARPSIHRPELGQELDAIMLKCLAKSPEGRYQSASGLAGDLQRYLDGRPIHALLDCQGYVFKKLLLTHKAIAVASAVALILLGYFLATLVRHWSAVLE